MTLSRLCLRRFHTGQVLREPSQVPQLYLQVLQAFPSQREAQQFLRRVTGRGRTAPALPTTVPPLSLPPRSKPAASKRVLPEADWVASLLNPTRQLIALVVVPTGLSPTHQAQVAQTLVNLVPLGLSPVVLLQPCYTRTAGPAATTTTTSCAEDPAVDATVRDRLQQQCLAFVARIEAVPGGLARPIPAGTVFRWSVADPHRIDTDLGPVMTSLKSHRIPVLTPLGVRASESGLATAVLPTDRALGALARRMSQDACGIPAVTPSAPTVDKERTAAPPLPPAVPAEACRVILVTPATPWWPAALTPRLDLGQLNFINLEDEYPRIRSALTGLLADRPTTSHTATDHAKARTALYTLDMIRDCLSVLPTTSSALLVTPDSVGRSIQNWITDKPIALRQASSAAGEVGVPPSGPLITTTRFSDLPATANSGSVALDTTASQRPSALVLRHGLKVTAHRSLDTVDLARLRTLLERSFGRTLQADPYWSRIRDRIGVVIVAGDYQGAAIVTLECPTPTRMDPAETEPPAARPSVLPYLDKFAIDPRDQGVGIADILWKNLDLHYAREPWTWRSRSDNGVNKWYFDRADGHLRVPGTHWVCFWRGAARWQHIEDFVAIAQTVPASFV